MIIASEVIVRRNFTITAKNLASSQKNPVLILSEMWYEFLQNNIVFCLADDR